MQSLNSCLTELRINLRSAWSPIQISTSHKRQQSNMVHWSKKKKKLNITSMHLSIIHNQIFHLWSSTKSMLTLRSGAGEVKAGIHISQQWRLLPQPLRLVLQFLPDVSFNFHICLSRKKILNCPCGNSHMKCTFAGGTPLNRNDYSCA